MIYSIGNQKINVPETLSASGRPRTPRQVVPWRDVAETCRTIDALLPEIKNTPNKIIDGVARSGFWGAVFLNKWSNCELILNEHDPSCFDILRKNFPKYKILGNDIHKWTPPESDILLLDFDDFTLKTSAKHKVTLKRIAPTTKSLLVADNTCFGFKFGNMKHYGVSTNEEYYNLLDKEMRPFLGGKRIVAVSFFANAAMILYENKSGEGIKFVPASSLMMYRGSKPYVGDYERNMIKQKKQSEGLWG